MAGPAPMSAPPAGLPAGLLEELGRLPAFRVEGRVTRCQAGAVVCRGLHPLLAIGDCCRIGRPAACNHDVHEPAGPDGVLAEVVAIDAAGATLVPFDGLDGIGLGLPVTPAPEHGAVRPSTGWLGRIVGPLAEPLDGGPPLQPGARAYPLQARALPAAQRQSLGARLDLGVRALNLFTPCRRGQRLGIFAGAGVGKSTLLAMLARHHGADALVLGLIGERGHELRSFLDDALGAAGRARSLIVVATSDQPPMLRRRAAQLTLSVAEALRDQGLEVLCLIDSLTRVAMALREIHLAAGEPPATKGYPASVFAELPRLLERAGPGREAASITGLFTVLAEGDDLSDPVADAVRAILDGHVVLDRRIAESGRFPAIDVLRSLSRTTPGCYRPEERPLIADARRLLRCHADSAELIQLGAYRAGADPELDRAIALRPALEAVLRQEPDEPAGLDDDIARLAAALGAAPS
jgi:flagellum-specific ATP synthase